MKGIQQVLAAQMTLLRCGHAKLQMQPQMLHVPPLTVSGVIGVNGMDALVHVMVVSEPEIVTSHSHHAVTESLAIRVTKKRLSHATRSPARRRDAWMVMGCGVSGIHGLHARQLVEGVPHSVRVRLHAWRSLVALLLQALTEKLIFVMLGFPAYLQ